ncbi:hypothetical protein PA598K_04738 [Paenibacillus sp. 598K]|uniref:DUF6470 family protein n=1 Tax=Paenibacillus sp. 598K TaxID=1117987 RepID=UPI000FF9CC7B|nr:DUF6470 family protein [Paenibacillus sp. 598K]GBF76283.1 hypothetical protein PA598K_04738 [Paenibacillus sp. 598K]
MNIPQIHIQQTPARIGIEAERGAQQLEQPRATLQMKQVRPQLDIQRNEGRLEVNQERAWDALALGKNLETMKKIYSMASSMALKGLGRVVEQGNRMAAIHHGGNPIADSAMDWKRTFPEFDFRGAASVDNVDIHFIPDQLSFRVERGRIDIQTEVNRPVHHYERGKLSIYMEQYNRVDITPPQVDRTG